MLAIKAGVLRLLDSLVGRPVGGLDGSRGSSVKCAEMSALMKEVNLQHIAAICPCTYDQHLPSRCAIVKLKGLLAVAIEQRTLQLNALL